MFTVWGRGGERADKEKIMLCKILIFHVSFFFGGGCPHPPPHCATPDSEMNCKCSIISCDFCILFTGMAILDYQAHKDRAYKTDEHGKQVYVHVVFK